MRRRRRFSSVLRCACFATGCMAMPATLMLPTSPPPACCRLLCAGGPRRRHVPVRQRPFWPQHPAGEPVRLYHTPFFSRLRAAHHFARPPPPLLPLLSRLPLRCARRGLTPRPAAAPSALAAPAVGPALHCVPRCPQRVPQVLCAGHQQVRWGLGAFAAAAGAGMPPPAQAAALCLLCADTGLPGRLLRRRMSKMGASFKSYPQ